MQDDLTGDDQFDKPTPSGLRMSGDEWVWGVITTIGSSRHDIGHYNGPNVGADM
jgi:hypothetical protein